MKTVLMLILAVSFYTVDSLSTLDATNTKGRKVFRNIFIHIRLPFSFATRANRADKDQTPLNAALD